MEKLANLSVYLSNPRISLNEKLLKICMTVKSAIPNCDRVGIWLFFVEHTEMVSLMCVDELGRKSNGEQLLASDYQDYFAHIIEHEFLVASDARNNDIAKCFNQGYFDVHNIHSLLDVTFKKDYIPLGIICCERTASKIDWQPVDIQTLKSISAKASLFISNNISDLYSAESKNNLIKLLKS
tara:strand:- start:16502 stop:17047 length:546 start_codon:yes stop_codon:yes gene_type:complete